MPVQVGHGAIAISIVDHRPIVAGENDERILGQTEPVERSHELADARVELLDHISANAAAARPREPRIRHPRHVGLMRGKVEKERFLLGTLEKLDRLPREDVRHVLIVWLCPWLGFIFSSSGFAAPVGSSPILPL